MKIVLITLILIFAATPLLADVVPHNTSQWGTYIYPPQQIDGSNLNFVLANWGTFQTNLIGNTWRDGIITGADLNIVLANWGEVYYPIDHWFGPDGSYHDDYGRWLYLDWTWSWVEECYVPHGAAPIGSPPPTPTGVPWYPPMWGLTYIPGQGVSEPCTLGLLVLGAGILLRRRRG
jgi:hypothetical protein